MIRIEVACAVYRRFAVDELAILVFWALVLTALTFGALSMVALLDIAAAVTYTTSGSTSLRAARERPAAPILSMSPNPEVARRMALVWGVHSVSIGKVGSLDEVVESARKAARDEGFAAPGNIIAITAGTPFNVPGTTDLLKLAVA